MVQGTGLHVLVERAISLNRPLRTRTVGGVGAGGEKPLATRLEMLFGRFAFLEIGNFGNLEINDVTTIRICARPFLYF